MAIKPKRAILAPQKGVQEEFLNNKCDIVLFGGSAGCVDNKTEFFSQDGWKRIDQYEEGDLVGSIHNGADLVLEYPEEFVKIPSEYLTEFKAKGISQALSDEHKVVYWATKDSESYRMLPFSEVAKRHELSKTKGWTGNFKTTFNYNNGEGLPYSEGELRLQVAVMADGRVVKEGKDNYTQMRFTKERKYRRLLELLKSFNLRFVDNKINNEGYYEVIVFPKTSDKMFTKDYYKASNEQLKIIFDEVFHWDGSIVENQSTKTFRYFSVFKENADFIQFVAASQGYNTNITEDLRRDRYTGTHYTVNAMESGKGFRCLANKDGKVPFNKIKTEDGYKYCFTVSSGVLLLRRDDKIFITGNSGKSHAILLDPLRHINDPDFYAVFFRKTTRQLDGSLWPAAKKLYRQFKVKIKEKEKLIIFPSGARISFQYLDRDDRAEENHQGIEYTAVYFDEFTHYTKHMFMYLKSRLRSPAEAKSYMKVSMNPDRDHFVFEWVEPYLLTEDVLDEHGVPIPEKRKGCPDRKLTGKTRYFIINNSKFVSSWDEEEIYKQYPRERGKAQTYTFIAG